MSEPVTNVEIEDVLSSIRRLVSDEARAPQKGEDRSEDVVEEQAQAPDKNEEKEAESPQVGRGAPALVLTEALRVVSPEAARESAIEAQETPEAASDASAPLILEPEHHAAAEAPTDHGQGAQPSESAPEKPDAAQGIAEEDSVEDAVVDLQSSEDEVAEITEPDEAETPDASDADAPIFESADTEEPRTIEDKIAALEALINRSDTDEFEPDGAEVGGNAGGRTGDALPWEDSRATRETPVAYPDPDQASETTEFDEGVSAFERARVDAVDAAAAELETDAAETLLENEELGAVLDEEALRDMVAEIVRQELQGPLGERITRNVRKLVRREIYRALAANELD